MAAACAAGRGGGRRGSELNEEDVASESDGGAPGSQSRSRWHGQPRAHWSAWPFMALIWGYRYTLGPLLGGHCRFLPTCSEYGLEAYRVHGPIRGTFLTIRRISRCHPWGGHGFDPVPLAPGVEKEENASK